MRGWPKLLLNPFTSVKFYRLTYFPALKDFFPAKYNYSFTVIEFIMLIVMMGILTVLYLPRFNIVKEIRLDTAVTRLISDIRYAQNTAVSYHKDVGIRFDPDNETYEIYWIQENTYLRDPSTGKDFIVNFSEDSQFKGIDLISANFDGSTVLIFTSLGRPKALVGDELKNQGDVVLGNPFREVKIVVYPGTGFCEREQ